MRFPRNTKIFRGQLDVAPFAGVFFLLIIFLLLNSSLVFTPGVPVHLPEAGNLPGTGNPTLVVAMDASGQIYFENQISSEERLKGKLQAAVAKAREPLTLVVQADKKVTYEMLVPLWLLAQSVGIKEVLQATRPPVVPTASASAKP
jgi:biopolymer transport protein ExbD